MANFKILVADSSRIYMPKMKSIIESAGLPVEIHTASDMQEALQEFETYRPDILLSNLILRGGDGFALGEIFKGTFPGKHAIAYSNVNADFAIQRAFAYGFDYFFVKPISEPEFVQRLKDLTSALYPLTEDLNNRVSEILLELGTPANLSGYRDVRKAILITLDNPKALDNITEDIYKKLAEESRTTPSRIERNMRHAIEATFIRGNLDVLERYFGFTVDADRGKPTNSAFIATIADNIRLTRERIF